MLEFRVLQPSDDSRKLSTDSNSSFDPASLQSIDPGRFGCGGGITLSGDSSKFILQFGDLSSMLGAKRLNGRFKTRYLCSVGF